MRLTVDTQTPIEPAKQSRSADALYFESRSNHIFGWMHRPSGVAGRDLALVICNPFGYEAICAHRGVRAIAESAAALGIPALRFDYAGTGNSSDIDPDADQVAIWSDDIIAAVGKIRQLTGVTEVCVLGIRLGAALAVLTASRCPEIGSLILMAPVVSGRRYLRELHMIQVAGYLSTNASVFGEAPPARATLAATGSGPLDVNGYTLSAATVEVLAKIDLTAVDLPAARDALIIDDDKLPIARPLAESLSARAIRVRYEQAAGFVDMLMTAPHLSRVPRNLIVLAVNELVARSMPVTPSGIRDRRRPDSTTSEDANTPMPQYFADGPPGGIVERAVFLDEPATLFGVVTEPGHARLPPRGVILLSIGSDHHIGAGRLYVDLARRWAHQGFFVLRFDLGGIGDSTTGPTCSDDDLHPAEALDDIRAAVEYLRNRYRIQDLTLAGVCSGAYHALRAAVAGLPVQRILAVNPECYLQQSGTRPAGLQIGEIVRNPHVYRGKFFSANAWKRLLRGEVDVWRIPVIYLRRAQLALDGMVHDFARHAGIRLREDLAHELHEATARGVRIVFVFARGEPGLELLRVQAGSAIAALGDRCRIHIVDFGDHTFSRFAPRLEMANVLTEELFA